MSMQRTDSRVIPGAAVKNRIVQWVDQRLLIFMLLRHELNEHPAPNDLNYLFGKDGLI